MIIIQADKMKAREIEHQSEFDDIIQLFCPSSPNFADGCIFDQRLSV